MTKNIRGTTGPIHPVPARTSEAQIALVGVPKPGALSIDEDLKGEAEVPTAFEYYSDGDVEE